MDETGVMKNDCADATDVVVVVVVAVVVVLVVVLLEGGGRGRVLNVEDRGLNVELAISFSVEK